MASKPKRKGTIKVREVKPKHTQAKAKPSKRAAKPEKGSMEELAVMVEETNAFWERHISFVSSLSF